MNFLEKVRNKQAQTMLINHGCENFFLSKEKQQYMNNIRVQKIANGDVNINHKNFKSGYWINRSNNKKEFYHSSYELKFMLKMNSLCINYTKNHGIVIPYSFKGKKRHYIPDFLIDDKYLIEIKPEDMVDEHINIVKFTAAIEYCEKNNLKFRVFTEKDLNIMTSSYNWKKTERMVAETLNTERNPFSGTTGGLSASDTLHEDLFVEIKTKKKHAVKTLYDSTVKLAEDEGKIPVLALRENGSEEILWVLEQKYLFQLLQEIDLHSTNPEIPEGTTVRQLLETSGSQEGQSLYLLQKDLDRQMEEIVMAKKLTKPNKQLLRGLAILSYYIESIIEFQKEEEGE